MAYDKTKDGRWFVQYWHPGEKRRKRIYFGRGKTGELAAAKKDAELFPKRTRRSTSPTFETLFDAYLTSKFGRIAESTRVNMMHKMESIIIPAIGHVPAIRITHDRVDRFVTNRLKAVKPSTVCRELDDINAVLNWSVKRKPPLLTYNPLAGYKKPRRTARVIRPPTPNEVARLLKVAPDRVRRAILLLYYGGVRPGPCEVFNIMWDWVDLEGKTIRVESAKKGGPVWRDVPLNDTLYRELVKWRRKDHWRYNYVVHYKGKPIKSIKKSFATAKEDAGITRKLRLYDFRHAFATTSRKHGGDLKAISEILGHSRPDTTIRIYQHSDFEQKRAAVDKMPDVLKPAKSDNIVRLKR